MLTQEQIEEYIKREITPALQSHGGDLQVLEWKDGKLVVKFVGACAGCMSSSDTFDDIVKASLLEKFPQIKEITLYEGVSDELIDFAKKLLHHDKADA